jgi:hypothetical protein
MQNTKVDEEEAGFGERHDVFVVLGAFLKKYGKLITKVLLKKI